MLLVIISVAQAPEAFKYQTVVRDGSNAIIPNQSVGLQISILQGSAVGPAVYVERHTASTNALGIVNLNIGEGTVQSGNFSTINWGTNSYYVKIELDPAGGTTYQHMGTSQLLSVPYALFAATTAGGGGSNWTLSGNNIYNSNTGNVGIGTSSPTAAKLHIVGPTSGAINSVRITGSPSGWSCLGLYDAGANAIFISNPLSSGVYVTGAGSHGVHVVNATGFAGYFEGKGYFADYVGIGISNPGLQLHIKQVEANRAIRVEHHTNTNYWNVGIGLSTFNYRFEYNGNGMSHISSTDGTYSTISDKSLKNTINPMGSVLQNVMSLKPSTYFMNNDPSRTLKIGFISQEVEQFFPELVSESDEGLKLLSYSHFSVITVKAIQEQQEMIMQLQQIVEELQSQINELKSK